jgi:hypothetical protein
MARRTRSHADWRAEVLATLEELRDQAKRRLEAMLMAEQLARARPATVAQIRKILEREGLGTEVAPRRAGLH